MPKRPTASSRPAPDTAPTARSADGRGDYRIDVRRGRPCNHRRLSSLRQGSGHQPPLDLSLVSASAPRRMQSVICTPEQTHSRARVYVPPAKPARREDRRSTSHRENRPPRVLREVLEEHRARPATHDHRRVRLFVSGDPPPRELDADRRNSLKRLNYRPRHREQERQRHPGV